MKTTRLIILVAAVFGAGCTSITGIDGSSSNFACKAPDGVTCTSVSGVYANAQQNNLPALTPRHRGQPSTQPTASPQTGKYNPATDALPVAFPGMPIRSQSKTMRVWVTPWTDEDGDLHDQTFIYVLVDPGRWLVEHTRAEAAKRSMVRLKALPVTTTANSANQAGDPPKPNDTPANDGVQSLRSFNSERTE